MENQSENTQSMNEEEKNQIARVMENNDIMSNDSGLFIFRGLNDMWRVAKMLIGAGMVPKAYKSPEMVVSGMQFAISLKLNPFVSLRQIAVINGQPSLWGDLPLGLARRTGELAYFKEYFIDKDYNEIRVENKNLHLKMWGAICIIERKGCERNSYSFTDIDYAKQGGQIKDIWSKYDKVMYMRKARALGLKPQFSDVLEGVIIAEYDYNILPDAGESYNVNHDGTENQESKAEKFKEKMNKKQDIEAVAIESKATNSDVVVDVPKWED